jgi:multiple sugar transport system substrate-binding protein
MLLPSQNGIAADTYSGVNRPRPTRRAFLAGSIGGASALALTGCSGDIVPHGALTLRFWNGFTGPDGRTMLGLVKRFNEQNPDVHVVMQRMEWGTYYNKLFVANLGGRAPQVFVIHSDAVTRFNRAEFLRPMDDLARPQAGPEGIDSADIDPNVWAAVERSGKHLGVPLDIHTIGTFYNRGLFRKARVVDAHGEPKAPRTSEEYVDALRKLTRDENGDGVRDTYGQAMTWLRTNAYTYIRQWGGDIMAADGETVILDQPEAAAGMRYVVDLIEKQKVIMPPETLSSFGGAIVGFRQGKLGMVFEGIYYLPELQRQRDMEFGAAPVPQMGPKPAAWASSHVLCIGNGLEGDELAAAKRFIKFLSDNSLDWAEGGQIPVRKSLRETDRFRGMTAQSAFASQIPHAAYLPQSPYINEYLAEFDPAVEKIFRRSATPEKAFADAAQRIRAMLDRYRQEGATA